MSDIRGNALVVGGTGMLARATDWLAERSDRTLLAARHASRAASTDRRFEPLDIDWNSPSFERDLTAAVTRLRPLRHALLWFHDPSPALTWLAPLLGQARTVILLGNLSGTAHWPPVPRDWAFVRLGSKPAGNGRRWLSHQEISDAAIAALIDGQSRVVGDLLPAD
ncbi:MAG: hypothetical protein P0Y64_03850 [Candidatus Sphingomonas colombiensis]|nr:hypothetical protein [Sphingomonas sp.]WEK43972.1 MAG: hypothetical protein P0Y64_03850 [Sphingomonas sp.]